MSALSCPPCRLAYSVHSDIITPDGVRLLTLACRQCGTVITAHAGRPSTLDPIARHASRPAALSDVSTISLNPRSLMVSTTTGARDNASTSEGQTVHVGG